MGLARSTYYDAPKGQPLEEARLVARIMEICAEWPRYGYRRVTAQLHNEGLVVNHKKVMRLMKENGLSVRPRRRFVATTESAHNGPIFANLTQGIVPGGPNQLWVADITYIAIVSGCDRLAQSAARLHPPFRSRPPVRRRRLPRRARQARPQGIDGTPRQPL
jgi:putative transposase